MINFQHLLLLLHFSLLGSLLMKLVIANEVVIEPNSNVIAGYRKSRAMVFEQIQHCFKENEVIRINPPDIHSKVYYNNSNEPVLVVDNWIDEIYAANVLIMTQCVKVIVPEKFEVRNFDDGGYGGGNNVTFLNEIMNLFYPDFISHVISVSGLITDKVGWQPHPYQLGIRCIELLEYGYSDELLWHDDEDSIYTLSIMLSDTNSYTGGTFLIDSSGNRDAKVAVKPDKIIRASPQQYGGLIFDSHAFHGVSPITNGSRTVLVIELWPFADSTLNDFRPDISIRRNSPKIPKLIRIPRK